MTAAYTWSHSIANVILDDSSGGIGFQSFTLPTDPGLDRGNSAINRPMIFTANFNYFLPDLTQANKFVRGAFGAWELGLITTEASGNSNTVYQGTLQENANLRAGRCLWRWVAGAVQQWQSPRNATSADCAWAELRHQSGDQVINPNAFTLVGYQIGTIPSNTEPRGYCRGPSLLDTDLSIDKNFKLTERVRMQFRMDFFNIFNHANFRGDQINGTQGGTLFSSVNCGPQLANGLYAPCSPTNNVIGASTGGDWLWSGDIGGRKRGPRNSVRFAHHFLIGYL